MVLIVRVPEHVDRNRCVQTVIFLVTQFGHIFLAKITHFLIMIGKES